ncbi:MAG: tetratricopeptide repeat protein [Acidobacteriota bacterium]
MSAQTLSEQGAKAMREGRYAEAERIYREMVKANPGEARLQLNLGLALYSAGRYEEALRELASFEKAHPKPGPVHLVMGTAHLKMGRACEAVAPLEKARQWQSSAQVLVELGDAQSGCKRYGDAGESYRAAAKLDAQGGKTARAAARAFWQARMYAEAKELFAQVEGAFAGEAEFLYEYGDTLARLDGAEAGLERLQKAVEKEPRLTAAHGALGRALLDVGKAAEAVPHLERAVAVDAALLLPLSKAYKAVGRAEDAARAEGEYKKKLGGK